jgi:hypothetical protein
MDILQGLIETGNSGKPRWRVVNNNGIFNVVNNKSSNIFSILNNGSIGVSSNISIASYSNINVVPNYGSTVITSSGDSLWTVGTSNIYNLSCNVGIGTNNPAVKLHVIGDFACSGDVSAYYSDERLKTKTGDIQEPLEIIDKLNGFYYIPNELARLNGITHNTQEIGLSAQDVQSVLPEIVKLAPFDLSRDADDHKISKSGENYLTISYERLAPVFVEAIKELKRENRLLNDKYNTLLQKIEKL